jgi:hypothetical protein
MSRRPSMEAVYYKQREEAPRGPTHNDDSGRRPSLRGSISTPLDTGRRPSLRGSVSTPSDGRRRSARRGSLTSSTSSLDTGSSPTREEKQDDRGNDELQQQQSTRASYEEMRKVLTKRFVAMSSEAHEKYLELTAVEEKARKIKALLQRHEELREQRTT